MHEKGGGEHTRNAAEVFALDVEELPPNVKLDNIFLQIETESEEGGSGLGGYH
jgi:hypothetical protein